MEKTLKRKNWLITSPWIILGALIILVPIFLFWTIDNINKQNEGMTRLLLEKGAALIRSFEAGTRTGMMGMMGIRGQSFQLQRLLIETAIHSDIKYIIVTNNNGIVLAHSEQEKIGTEYGSDLDLETLIPVKETMWRKVDEPDKASVFEVFRTFKPARRGMMGPLRRKMLKPPRDESLNRLLGGDGGDLSRNLFIFIGLDMAPVETATREDVKHTIMMGVIFLLVGFAGIFSLFIVNAYLSTRSSLSRIKAFSDNLVENMPAGLLALDPEERIATFNQGAEEIFSIRTEDALGKKINILLPSPVNSVINEMKNESAGIEKNISFETKNGKTVSLVISGSPLKGEDDIFLGSILLFKDVTEIRQLQREVERNQRLASLGRLAAGIAHEIRNPLSSIKGFATYFGERYKDEPEDLKTAQIMVQEVERLNRVIGQLLEFARPLNVQKKPASIRSLVQHSIKMIELETKAKDIKIKTEFADNLPDISFDQDRMYQVFLNIFLNAVESMADGGELNISVFMEGQKGMGVIIRDTGNGIKEEDLEHVFDPYFTTKSSGTGLGLAIVHKIMESHDGEVKVVSEKGKGTEVTVFLPV